MHLIAVYLVPAPLHTSTSRGAELVPDSFIAVIVLVHTLTPVYRARASDLS